MCVNVVNSAYVEQYGAPRYRSADRVAAAILADRMVMLRDDNGVVVACAEHEEPEAQGSVFRFGPLAVAPGSQGAGRGGALLAELERRARRGCCLVLEVEVRRGGEQGQRLLEFYRRAGYEPWGPRHRNYAMLVKRLA